MLARLMALPLDKRCSVVDLLQCQLVDTGCGTSVMKSLARCFKASGCLVVTCDTSLGRASRETEVALCSSPVAHFSQRGSVEDGSGWACGYRNLQMLVWSLLGSDPAFHGHYGARLFGGCGFVPQLHFLQAWLDTAWALGTRLLLRCEPAGLLVWVLCTLTGIRCSTAFLLTFALAAPAWRSAAGSLALSPIPRSSRRI